MSENDAVETPLRVPVPRQRALSRADLAGQFETLTGRRVVLVNEAGTWYDFRAVSEVTLRRTGFGDEALTWPFVAVAAEAAWYANGETVARVWWPAGAVWIEEIAPPSPSSAPGA